MAPTSLFYDADMRFMSGKYTFRGWSHPRRDIRLRLTGPVHRCSVEQSNPRFQSRHRQERTLLDEDGFREHDVAPSGGRQGQVPLQQHADPGLPRLLELGRRDPASDSNHPLNSFVRHALDRQARQETDQVDGYHERLRWQVHRQQCHACLVCQFAFHRLDVPHDAGRASDHRARRDRPRAQREVLLEYSRDDS